MPNRIDVLALGKWIFVPVLGGVVAYYVVTMLVGQSAPSTPAPVATQEVSIDQDSGSGAAPPTPSDSGGNAGSDPAVTPASDSTGDTLEADAPPAGITAPEVDVTVSPDRPDDAAVKHRRPHKRRATPPKPTDATTEPAANDGTGSPDAASNGGATGGGDEGTTDGGSSGTADDGNDTHADQPKPKPKRKRRGSKNPPPDDNGDGAGGVG